MSLGTSFGLSTAQVRECVEYALDATSDYIDRVMGMKKVPETQREQLIEIVQNERELLDRYL